MKKHFLISLCIMFLMLTGKSQNAEQVFKSAVDKLKAYSNIEIAFEYNMINKDAGIFETMEGTGFIQGDSYKINVAGQEMISDGKTSWTYLPDSEEVMVSAVDEKEGGSPLAIINKYYDNINAKFIEGSNADKKYIEVSPKTKDEMFGMMTVAFDSKTMNLSEVHVFDNNGSEFVYNLTKFVTNQTLPADFFTFKAEEHPNAEIIDMR